jgi:purine-binding chemotaxis protein CheW
LKTPNADAAQILRARAIALSRPPAAEPPAGTLLEMLEFRLASERYAVETRHVQEVQPLRDLTPLPGTPPFVPGIVNVRGRIIPVFDLRKLFDLPEQGLTDLHRIVLIHGNGMELGLLADVIVGVHNVRADSLQPALPTLTGIRADYLKGIGKGIGEGPLVVLDMDRILSDPRIIVHDEADG